MSRILFLLLLLSSASFAAENTTISSFHTAKKNLERKVYFDHRETLYCSAIFDDKKRITPPIGFSTQKHKKRAKKVEWEHVVPAENFGRTFVEWREGNPQCISKKGKSFKGRRCTEKINMKYRYMQSDMYNLFPAIGAVNAMRSNYNFVASVSKDSEFGSCNMKISNRKVEPPVSARGRIARTYLYMQNTYKRYKMGKPQAKLMIAWDKMYPVTPWECTRAKRIEQIQGNKNNIISVRCNGN